MLFGLAPALAASRVNLNDALKDGSRGSGGVRGGYLSGALVVFQFTLSVVLLSGAGLMMRSFLVAQNEFAEMNGAKVLSTRVTLPASRYPKAEDRQRFFEKLLPRVASMPGVQAAALISNPPGEGAASWNVEIAGKPIADAQRRPAVSAIVASKRYLQLLGVGLLSGKDFEDDGRTSRQGNRNREPCLRAALFSKSGRGWQADAAFRW